MEWAAVSRLSREEGLRVGLLGPVEVIDDQGAAVSLASSRQRLLLAGLCLRAGEFVGSDWLVELLWSGALPEDPTAALQSQMSRLRRRLGPGVPVTTIPGGYRMEAPEIVDAIQFRRLAVEASSRRGRDAPAALDAVLGTLDAALALWRGRPLADLDHPLLDHDVSSLVQDYAAVAEKRIVALIEKGAHSEAVAAAKKLSKTEPFRESLVALHMEALARAGRPSDALDVYERFRRTLAHELGLDPSTELREAHRRVLATSTDPVRRALPVEPRTSLVGRDDTVATLVELLSDPGLVTLTGPGGVGKTRLAVRAAHTVETNYRDGVWFCDLSSVPSGGSVPAAVAPTLGVDPQPGNPLEDLVVEFLRPRQALVVLDNCEHVIDSAATLVSRTLAAAPRVTVLATSRERLRLPGEHRLPVYPLPTEHSSARGPAVQLFCDRALAADPTFTLGAADTDVAELCQMLGGLPLAIEIAAARVAARSPADLRAELHARGGQLPAERGRPRRHASLHAIVAWSAELLDPESRAVFERLAVFAGGWQADAAAAIAEGDCADQIEDVLDHLSECSLISAVTTLGRTRWNMLDPVRDYADHELDRHDHSFAARDRHAEFFADFAEQATVGLLGQAERHWADQLTVEMHNLRSAHRWLIDNNRVRTSLTLVSSCYPWVFAGAPAEVAGWAREAAERFADTDDPKLVGALATAAAGAWRHGDANTAIELATRGAELGSCATPARRWALDALGDANIIAGRYEHAIEAYRAAIPLAEASGDPVTMCNSMGSIALSLAYQGRTAEAIAQADEVVHKTARIDNPSTQGWAHYFAGETRVDTQPHLALPLLRRAVAEAERAGNRFLLGVSLVSLVSAQARIGDAADTLQRYSWLITYWQQTGAWTQLWITVHGLIEALHRRGRTESAAVLLGALDASPTAPPLGGPDADRLTAIEIDLKDQLGPDHFNEFRAEGAAMNDTDALSYMLAALSQ
jgi:predicted ATPase/DNA-binding SARP family transcriptional activator